MAKVKAAKKSTKKINGHDAEMCLDGIQDAILEVLADKTEEIPMHPQRLVWLVFTRESNHGLTINNCAFSRAIDQLADDGKICVEEEDDGTLSYSLPA